MANASVLLPNRQLNPALNLLITQMITASQSVNQSTVGSSVTVGSSNNGSGTWAISSKTATGLITENAFQEGLTATVVADSQNNGVRVNNENINITGVQAQSNPLFWNYPLGSGCNLTITACDPTRNAIGGTANNLFNSDFTTFASNLPTNWVAIAGSSQISQDNIIVVDAGNSVKITGLNGTNTEFQQVFNSSSGTTIALQALTQYAVIFWIKTNNAPAGGTLRVSLVNGSNTVINDAQGTANSFNVNLATIGTSFVAVSGIFRTPRLLPSSIALDFKLTTPLSTGTNAYIGRCSLNQMTSLYSQAPYVSFQSAYGGSTGSTILLDGDTWTLNITNNYAGQFQQAFNKLFNMAANGFLLPSSVTPTVSDGLITS